MGGSNSLDNLIELEIHEHALAHYELYIKYGKIQDKIAWLALSGKTVEAELLRKKLALDSFRKWLQNPVNKKKWRDKISKTLTGRKLTVEHRKNISKSLTLSYKTGRKYHVKASLEFYRNNYYKNKFKMEEARRNSKKWRESVTNQTYRELKSKNTKGRNITWGNKIAEAKLDKKLYNSIEININGILFNSLSQASRYFKIPRWKIEKLTKKLGNSFTINI